MEEVFDFEPAERARNVEIGRPENLGFGEIGRWDAGNDVGSCGDVETILWCGIELELHPEGGRGGFLISRLQSAYDLSM